MAARVFAGGIWSGVAGLTSLVFQDGTWGPNWYEAEIDFTTKGTAAMPSTMDTGQSIVKTWNTTSAADPKITNGRYVIDVNSGSSQAGYLTLNQTLDNGQVTYMRSTFQIAAGAGVADWNLGLVPWDFQMPVGSLTAISSQNSPCHLVFTNTGWIYGVWQTTTLNVVATRTYSPTIDHSAAPRTVSVRINKAGSQAFVTGADGVEVTISDSRIGSLNGDYACCEIYYGTASTGKRVEVYDFKATSEAGGVVEPDKPLVFVAGSWSR